MKKYIIIAFFIILATSSKTFAAVEIDKNLYLYVGTSHILTFDDKITGYKFENAKNYKADVLSSIFGGKYDIIVKSLTPAKDKLTVWTKSKTYTFEIDSKTDVANITDLENFEADAPPSLSVENSGVSDYELDTPPVSAREK